VKRGQMMAKNVFGQVMDGFVDMTPDERHEDTRRLDWLERTHHIICYQGSTGCFAGRWFCVDVEKESCADDTIRGAIDAAIKEVEDK